MSDYESAYFMVYLFGFGMLIYAAYLGLKKKRLQKKQNLNLSSSTKLNEPAD